jgi:uncharacterized protein (DUF362 family)
MDDNKVYILKTDHVTYPAPPFHPAERFPEFDLCEIDEENRIYGMVREALLGLGMDRENFGTSAWNPLGTLVKPGDKVVVKPNLVFDSHRDGHDGVRAMITHASVIRPLIDYVLKASQGTARITICDAPVQSASWQNLITQNHYKDLVVYYRKRGIQIELIDLRIVQSYCNKYGGVEKTISLPGDPRGNCVVDLGADSCFEPIARDSKKFEITCYPHGTVALHHNETKNEYLISRTVLEADVFINVPKIKTHRKAGVTLSLKNLVGINADKSWIAHHRRGSVTRGGDEYDKQSLSFRLRTNTIMFLREYRLGVFFLTYFISPAIAYLSGRNRGMRCKDGNTSSGKTICDRNYKRRAVTEGNWYGNDTLWRTILDINRCLFYADATGTLHSNKQRRYLTLADGILAMEEEGPMDGRPKEAGLLVAAYNPVASDYVTAAIMGFAPEKIPSIRESFCLATHGLIDYEISEIAIESNCPEFMNITQLDRQFSLKFIPPSGWQGQVEKGSFDGTSNEQAMQDNEPQRMEYCEE